jgi:hypothetical protein
VLSTAIFLEKTMASIVTNSNEPSEGVQMHEFPDTVLVAQVRSISRGSKDSDQSFRSSLPVDVVVYLVIAALILAAWRFSQMKLFDAGDDVGYWLGVAGGVTMLLLFSYPLRKHFKFTRNWGRVKWWFLVHMFLGVGGPVLILIHSTFRVGSLNAGVALYSMLLVAASGVVGRFIYARVNRGLRGEQASLNELRTAAGIQEEDARSRLSFAPTVEQKLAAFEDAEVEAQNGWVTYTRQLLWLPFQQWLMYRECGNELRVVLYAMAKRERWKRKDFNKRLKYSKALVGQYLTAVTRVAQFKAYERFFSLWHVVHIPFVYLMFISAVVHVFAVHIY